MCYSTPNGQEQHKRIGIIIMRLSDWAKKNNVSYRTARRYYDQGKISGAYRISERIIIVPDKDEKSITPERTAIYARVSSHDQKQDLQRQSQRLQDFAIENGYQIVKIVEEIASGMNPHRKKLISLLENDEIDTIIVENRDRLARMNAELIIAASPKNIIIVNTIEPEHNDMQDVIDFLTSVCARQHGKRSAKNRAKEKAKQLCEE